MKPRTLPRAFEMSAALLSLAFSMLAPAATITKIIGPSDRMPDSTDTVREIAGRPVFDEAGTDQFLVVLSAGFGPAAYQALYRGNALNQFQRIAATGTATSRGAVIASFGDYTMHGGAVYFVGFDASFTHYLCKVTEPGGPVTVIAAKGDVIAGTDKYEGFIGGLSAYAGGLAFDAVVNQNNFTRTYNDVFHYDGSGVTSLAGYGAKPVPGFDGALFFMNQSTAPVVRNGEVAFLGSGLVPLRIGSVQGLYALPLPGGTGAPRKIVDNRDKAPGSDQTLTQIGRSTLQLPLFGFDSGEAVFFATSFDNSAAGFYRHTVAGGLAALLNRETTLPESTQKFDPATFIGGDVSFSGGRMALAASDDQGNRAIYLYQNGSLQRLLSTGQEVGGVTLNFFTLHSRGLSGNQLIFSGNSALYRAVLDGGGGPAPTPVPLHIAKNGDQVIISWDAAAAGPAAELQSTASLTAPDWRKVPSQANPATAATASVAQYFRLKQ